MKRRSFLKACLASAMLPGTGSPLNAQEAEQSSALPLRGSIRDVHDSVIIKQDDIYYLFSTGYGIAVRRSDDLQNWRSARGGSVFARIPDEAARYVPGASNIWAPDISYYNDRYQLYYSVSTFGSNRSAIGLATNATLHNGDENYEWIDHGIVVQSDYGDDFNAIDANFVLDADDEAWLAFGSHWSGIKLIKLDRETGKQAHDDRKVYSLASRARHPRAIEAPFIIHRGEFNYLFVSFDRCCAGAESTYNVRVGRAEEVTGPYIDRAGVDMMNDGGTQITFADERFKGPGHNAIFSEDGRDFIVFHAYDSRYGGTPTLQIHELAWDDEGWLFIPDFQVNG